MTEQSVHLERPTGDKTQRTFATLLREGLVEVHLEMLHEIVHVLGDRSLGIADQSHLQTERTLDQPGSVVLLVEMVDRQMVRGTLIIATGTLVRQL